MVEGPLARTLLRTLYEFEVTSDPTWLVRRFGDELGSYLEVKMRTRPRLSKLEASVLVQLVVRMLKDQATDAGRVVEHPHMGLKGKEAIEGLLKQFNVFL
jgi:hypothetical protein